MGAPARALLTLAAGVTLATTQTHPSLWMLAGVALVPWIRAAQRASRLEAGILGALFGVAFTGAVVPWIPEALRALGSSWATSLGGLVLTAVWAKVPLFAACGLLAHAVRRATAAAQVLGLATAFGGGEWILSTWSAGVPAALIGHSQLPAVGVAQLAVVGGVPLVSAWLVALNAAVAAAIAGRTRALSLATGIAASWLAMAALGLPLARSVRPSAAPGREVALLLVQPDLPRPARWDPGAQAWILETMAEHTTEALARAHGPVDAILWPENLLTAPLEANPKLAAALRAHVDAWATPLLTGLVRTPVERAPRQYRSSVAWIEARRGLVSAIDKARAVPLLESDRNVPAAALLGPLFGRAARWPKVEEAPRTVPLDGPLGVVPALCYEVLFPRLVAHRRTRDSVAIVNLADDSWVKGPAATRDLTRWAAFRAIEQRLPLIRVAHGGLSTFIDEFGRSRMALPLDAFASATVRVAPTMPPTFLERSVLLGLPLALGIGVGWGHAWWLTTRRRVGGVAARDQAPPAG